LLSTFAFNSNLRRYSTAVSFWKGAEPGMDACADASRVLLAAASAAGEVVLFDLEVGVS